MSLLYIVAESGNDAFLYALLAERFTGREAQQRFEALHAIDAFGQKAGTLLFKFGEFECRRVDFKRRHLAHLGPCTG